MSAPFTEILLAIQARVAEKVPAIRYVDQDLGQLNQPRPPVSWPCLLVDMEKFNYDNLAGNVQTALGTVVFRLGFPAASPSASLVNDETKTRALAFYDLEAELYRALQGWAPITTTGKFSRQTTTTQHRRDALRVREMTFTLSFEDWSAARTVRYVPVGVDVEVGVGER